MAAPFDTLDVTVTTATVVGRMGLHVVDPLVWPVRPGEYAPGLATSWTVSPDATAYTFNLRDDVKFHDGTPFNAEAVKVTFDRIVDPATKSQTAFSFIGPYDRTEVLGPHRGPRAVQASLCVVPERREHRRTWGSSRPPPCGDTARTLARWSSSRRARTRSSHTSPAPKITLVRNINYNWASRIFKHNGAPYLQRIVYKIITEPSTRLATLETGEAHFIEDVPPTDLERVKRNRNFKVIEIPQAGSGWSLMFNQQRPPTNELAVRRAVQLADRQGRPGQSRLGRRASNRPAARSPPTCSGLIQETCKKYPRNVDQARRVLDEAGWQMGPDGIRVKGGQTPGHQLLLPDGEPQTTRDDGVHPGAT